MNLTKIVNLLDEAKRLESERAQIARLRKVNTEIVDRIMEDGRIDEGAEQKKFAEAQFVLNMLPAREKKLAAHAAKHIPELVAEEKIVAQGFNRQLAVKIHAVRSEIVKANRPFFPDSEDLLHQTFDRLFIPAVHRLARVRWDAGGLADSAPADQIVQTIAARIAAAQRHAKSLGIEIDES